MSDGHTALEQSINPFRLFQQRNASSASLIHGDVVKCNHQTGEWVRVHNKRETPIGPDERFIVNPHDMIDSWSKWVGGKRVAGHTYRTALGEMAPERNELGDTDEEEWPFKNGQPKDPWARAVYLPLKDSAGEVCTFVATGQGAIGEVGELVGTYAAADRHGKFPVVTLTTRDFENQHGNTVYVPVFRLIDWDFWEPNAPAPDVQPVAVPPPPSSPPPSSPSPESKAPAKSPKRGNARRDMDDEIPF
jgi:hypothetical protein